MIFTSTLAESLAEDVLERFTRYVRIDTQSERDRKQSPSTPGQLDLSRLLVEELLEIGLSDAALDENGYVTATLPGDGPVVGLIAHVDTSPDAPGAGVEPIVHRAHPGGPIELPRNGTVVDGLPGGHDSVPRAGYHRLSPARAGGRAILPPTRIPPTAIAAPCANGARGAR